MKEVGIQDSRYAVAQIWAWIDRKEHTFFTNENNRKAIVYARKRNDGTIYLTSHPDTTTENNLDELPNCR